MYGAYWCPHCADQKEVFGRSFDYVPYIECGIPGSREEAPACNQVGIKHFPTWQFARRGTSRRHSTSAGPKPKKPDVICHNVIRHDQSRPAHIAVIAVFAVGGARSLRLPLSSLRHSQSSYCDFGESFNCDMVNRSTYSTFSASRWPDRHLPATSACWCWPLFIATSRHSRATHHCVDGRAGLRTLSDICRRIRPGRVVHSMSVFAGTDFYDLRAVRRYSWRHTYRQGSKRVPATS